MASTPVIGRFAPTPSGPLHFGSLVTAVASYCHSKSQQGQWLLRIEDVDTPRVVKGCTPQMLTTLEAFGFEWDGEPLYQSQQFDRYQASLAQLLDRDLAYACSCSRRSLSAFGAQTGPMGVIYPGLCRDKQLAPDAHSIRLNCADIERIHFQDQSHGAVALNIRDQVGDFVLRRVDGIYAYHLAVVLDDAMQGINQVMRGADLLLSTCLHLVLQRLLDLPTPEYWHIPLAMNAQGDKLSKQTGARAIDTLAAPAELLSALHFLGQPVSTEQQQAGCREILRLAIRNWDPALMRQNVAPVA